MSDPLTVRTLVIATKNPGKVREFRQLLGDLPLELLGAEAMPEVEEKASGKEPVR